MALLSKSFDPIENIPTNASTQEEWISWYKTLKSNFGAQNANALWVKGWKRYGGSPNANTHELRIYMEKQGIKIDKDYFQSVFDNGVGFADFIGSGFQVARYMGIALGVIIVGGLGLVIYNLAKDPARNVGIALKAAALKKGGKI